MKKNVLGVKIDDMNMDQALEMVGKWLYRGEKHYIVTPNPEIVVMAQKDEELKKVLNNADLAIPDGAGLKLTGDIVCHIPGIDFMEELIKVASKKGFTIGLLGGRDLVAKKSAECLRKKYPKLKVSFADSGGEVDKDGNIIRAQREVESSRPSASNNNIPSLDILFVAFGPPKQEKWIYQNLPKINVKVAMGVGGSFDIISGKVPRAPKWLRDLGLEWLFRLIIQPWRIKRQLALLKFVLMVL